MLESKSLTLSYPNKLIRKLSQGGNSYEMYIVHKILFTEVDDLLKLTELYSIIQPINVCLYQLQLYHDFSTHSLYIMSLIIVSRLAQVGYTDAQIYPSSNAQ